MTAISTDILSRSQTAGVPEMESLTHLDHSIHYVSGFLVNSPHEMYPPVLDIRRLHVPKVSNPKHSMITSLGLWIILW